MDSKGQVPEIKTEVNKLPEKKKKAGFLASLFGGGGSGGAMGGLGGGGLAGGGAIAGGGLLATKTGLIAMIVIGSAVAGSLGMAGYKLFGPGESDQMSGTLELFAPRPKETGSSDPSGMAPVPKDGSSASLNYLAETVAKERAAEAAAAGDAASDVPPSGADASSGANGAINAGSGGAGALGSMNKGLANVKKLGELSKGGSGGGGSVTASAGAGGAKLGEGLPAGARGSMGAMARGGGKASTSMGRAVASNRRGGTGRQQLASVMRDHNRGPVTSAGAGHTYDGGNTTLGSIGPDGGTIGMEGPGAANTAHPRDYGTNTAPNMNQQQPPIPKMKHMITPWEKALQRVQMMAMLALALALVGSKMKGEGFQTAARIMIGLVLSAMAVYAAALSMQIMSGPYGQKTQGMLALTAAAGIGIMAGMVLTNTAMFEGSEISIAGATPLMMLGGGMALIGTIGGFFSRPKQIELKEGQLKPDVSYIEAIKTPVDYRV